MVIQSLLGKVAIVLLDIWQWTPFVFLVSLAGLQGLSQDLTEASEVDGAAWWQSPPHCAAADGTVDLADLAARAIEAFKVFDTVVN